MKTVPIDVLHNLLRALNKLSDSSQRTIVRLLAGGLTNNILDVIIPLFVASTDAAATYATNMYDDLREYEIGQRLPATPKSNFRPDVLKDYVSKLIENYLTEKGVEYIAAALKRRMSYELKRAAGQSVAYNARHDPKGPRFARVPTGPDTCEFCIMLASRGYVYASAKSAGGLDHWHENCDCVIVPQFSEEYQVKGYDPDKYLKMWTDNVEYTENGTVDTKATLKNIRYQTGRDAKYYEQHKEERHDYYERVKAADNGEI